MAERIGDSAPPLPGCPRCDNGRAAPSGNCLPRCVAAMAMLTARRAAARALVAGPGAAAVWADEHNEQEHTP